MTASSVLAQASLAQSLVSVIYLGLFGCRNKSPVIGLPSWHDPPMSLVVELKAPPAPAIAAVERRDLICSLEH
jgi:hypothetical protein